MLTGEIPIVVVLGSREDLGGLDVDCVLRKPDRAGRLVQAVRSSLRRHAGRGAQ